EESGIARRQRVHHRSNRLAQELRLTLLERAKRGAPASHRNSGRSRPSLPGRETFGLPSVIKRRAGLAAEPEMDATASSANSGIGRALVATPLTLDVTDAVQIQDTVDSLSAEEVERRFAAFAEPLRLAATRFRFRANRLRRETSHRMLAT